MIRTIKFDEVSLPISLKAEGIGGKPLYVFLTPNKKKIICSTDLTILLQQSDVNSNLTINNESISHLLQCGVIPPPLTVYDNLFLLGIGDTATVIQIQEGLVLSFSHEFIYTEQNLKKQNNSKFRLELLLEKVASAVRSQANMNRKINLFHTAGKDSNIIALALHRHFEPEQLRFVCHQSEGHTDESNVSRKIAKKLGIEHLTIGANLALNDDYLMHIHDYFANAPFPLLDNVTLAFPEYVMKYPDLRNSNIVIGDGNDTYMMSPPSLRDEIGIELNRHLHLRPLSDLVKSENPLGQLCRTPFEWARMSGFNDTDSSAIYKEFIPIRQHWNDMRKRYQKSPAIDIKSHSYACYIIYEVYLRKFRNYCTHINSNLIMPFFDPAVVSQILEYEEKLIVNIKSRSNKPIFRKVIKNELGVDSETIGKKGYTLNTVKFIAENKEWVIGQIVHCSLWDQEQVRKLANRLFNSTLTQSWTSRSAARLIYRLLMISLWYNNSQYLNHAG